MRSPGRFAVWLGLLFGLTGTSSSAVTVALPQLAVDLDISVSTAAWIISGYAVALAPATLAFGRLADIAGIRAPFCVGVAAMSGGALAAALAPNFAVLMVARVVQGIGAGAVPVLVAALVSALLAGDVRSATLGRVAGVAATLASLGPLAGGALAELGGWRLAVALPVIGLLALPLLWDVAPTHGTGERLDVTGAALVAMAATGLVLLIQSPAAGVVTAAAGAGLLAVGVPATALRVRALPAGFLPRAIVTNPAVLRTSFAAASVPACWFALLLGVPLVAAGWGWSPLATGLLLVPSALTGFAAPAMARAALDRLGARRTMLIACPIAAASLVVAALGGALTSPVLLATAVIGVTIAFGLGHPAMTAAVGAAVPDALRGVALGVATLVFLVGASVGAALVGGLAEVSGVPVAFAVLVALPLAGIAALIGGSKPTAEDSGP